MTLHGAIRSTADIDIWIEPTTENWSTFIATVHKLDYPEAGIKEIENDFTGEPQRFGLEGPMDVLTRVHFDFDFGDVYSRSLMINEAGVHVRLISLKDLRELKVRTGRTKDLFDVLMIDKVLEKGSK